MKRFRTALYDRISSDGDGFEYDVDTIWENADLPAIIEDLCFFSEVNNWTLRTGHAVPDLNARIRLKNKYRAELLVCAAGFPEDDLRRLEYLQRELELRADVDKLEQEIKSLSCWSANNDDN